MNARACRHALGVLLSVAALPAGAFQLHATTDSGSPSNPATLITVSALTGEQTLRGGIGLAVNSRAIDFDPATGSLFGVDFVAAPGVLHRIDAATGVSSAVATVRDTAAQPVSMAALSFAPDGTLYAATWSATSQNTIGRVDRATNVYTPLLSLPAGQATFGMDASPAGVLYAVYVQTPFAQTLVSIDVASMSVSSEVAIGDLNAGDLDYAPDGNVYHSNSSFALIRLDPVTGLQTNIGFGSVGALAGVASFVPVPPAIWMMLGGLLALSRMVVRVSA